MNTHTAPAHTRLTPQTRDRLREHAADVGRSLAAELARWAEFGAAASFYAALIDPRARQTLDADEIGAAREATLAEMRRALDRALPHSVAPDVISAAVLPPVSAN
jgi:hypothetical protein